MNNTESVNAIHIPLEDLASYTVLRLMQYIDVNKQSLGHAAIVALYEDWLRLVGGPEAYVVHFNLGVLQQEAGQSAHAETQYRAALRLLALPEARFNLGVLMEQSGRLHEAMSQWRHLVGPPSSKSPLHMMALDALIRVSRRLGLSKALQRYISQSLELNVDQPALTRELTCLAMDQLETANGMQMNLSNQPKSSVIYVVAVCFNEAAILPFFLDHYINFVGASKVVLHDGGSTDATAKIVARFPQVELVVSPSEKLDDRDLMRIRNEEWKKYRDQCDWMVVCDVDEFVYHPQIRTKLLEFKQQGVTLPMIEGFEMLSKTHPHYAPGEFIWNEIQTGVANPRYYNKNLIFDPSIDINYTLGCHSCQPTGPVKRSEDFVFKNLHYRMLSHQHIVAKSRRAAARLSDWNKQTNAGFHYQINAEMSRADYNKMFVPASNVVNPRSRPPFQREVFEAVLRHLLALDQDPTVLELGVARGFGSQSDSGSTEFFAWYVHNFGGHFYSIDAEPLAIRHAGRELSLRGLAGRRLSLIYALRPSDAIEELQSVDLLFINSGDYQGDEQDLTRVARAALNDFLDVELRLTPDAVIVLDAVRDVGNTGDASDDGGKFRLLVPYLLGCQYSIQQAGYTSLFSKKTIMSNA